MLYRLQVLHKILVIVFIAKFLGLAKGTTTSDHKLFICLWKGGELEIVLLAFFTTIWCGNFVVESSLEGWIIYNTWNGLHKLFSLMLWLEKQHFLSIVGVHRSNSIERNYRHFYFLAINDIDLIFVSLSPPLLIIKCISIQYTAALINHLLNCSSFLETIYLIKQWGLQHWHQVLEDCW